MLKGFTPTDAEGLIKARALFVTLGIGFVFGLFRNWESLRDNLGKAGIKSPFLDTMSRFGIPNEIQLESLDRTKGHHADGLAFEPSLLLTATGLIVGLRISITMFVGSCLVYFVLTPVMFDADQAWLLAHHGTTTGFKAAMEITADGAIKPLKWALWGGTAMMVMSSFTTLALQWRTLVKSFSGVFSKKTAAIDPVADLEVPVKWAIRGGVPTGLGLVLALWLGFGVNPLLGAISVMISCVIAVVCCRAAAETDINPIGPMGKVTQLIYAVLPGASHSATINLVSAGATSAAAGSSADMMSDFKTSHLLGANSRKVFIAQVCGVFFGILCVIPAWYLIIPDKAHLEKFPAIPAKMWSAVAQFLTNPKETFYYGAPTLIVLCAVIGVALPLLAHLFPKAAKGMPSAMGLGLACIMPFSNSLSFLIGALIMAVWEKGHKKSAVFFALIVASGLMSGQAMSEAFSTIGGEATILFHHK